MSERNRGRRKCSGSAWTPLEKFEWKGEERDEVVTKSVALNRGYNPSSYPWRGLTQMEYIGTGEWCGHQDFLNILCDRAIGNHGANL